MRYETFFSTFADDYLTLPVERIERCQRCGGMPELCWLLPLEAPPRVLCRACATPGELQEVAAPHKW